jgi:hypothetical protein
MVIFIGCLWDGRHRDSRDGGAQPHPPTSSVPRRRRLRLDDRADRDRSGTARPVARWAGGGRFSATPGAQWSRRLLPPSRPGVPCPPSRRYSRRRPTSTRLASVASTAPACLPCQPASPLLGCVPSPPGIRRTCTPRHDTGRTRAVQGGSDDSTRHSGVRRLLPMSIGSGASSNWLAAEPRASRPTPIGGPSVKLKGGEPY